METPFCRNFYLRPAVPHICCTSKLPWTALRRQHLAPCKGHFPSKTIDTVKHAEIAWNGDSRSQNCLWLCGQNFIFFTSNTCWRWTRAQFHLFCRSQALQCSAPCGIHPAEGTRNMLRNLIEAGGHQPQRHGSCRNLLLFIKKKLRTFFFCNPRLLKSLRAPH